MIGVNYENEPKLVLKNLGNKTKGPLVIAVALLNAKKSKRITKVSYNIVNKPVNYNAPMNAILNYIGFKQTNNPYTVRVIPKLSNINNKKLLNITQGNLNNYKRYMNQQKNKYINKRIEKFNKGFASVKNVKLERPSKYVRIIKTPNNKAHLKITNINKNTIHYAYGETNKNVRGRGYGTLLRRVPINIARAAGYKKIAHSGVWMNNNKNKNKPPPSTRIVNRLGFKVVEILPYGSDPKGQYYSERVL